MNSMVDLSITSLFIVKFPMKNGGSFHSYVSHYQAGYIHGFITVPLLEVDECSMVLQGHRKLFSADGTGDRVS